MTSDIRVSGSCSIGGGEYGSISVQGSGKADGDIKASRLNVSGSFKVNGNAEAGDIKISGSAKCKNILSASSVKISGSVSCEDIINVGVLKVSGSVRAGNMLNTQDISISGSVNCGEIIGAEKFSCEFYSNCKCGDLKAGNIAIAPKKGRFLKIKKIFSCTNIIGDDISLTDVEASYVEGKNISIGGGSHICEVKYSDTYSVSENAAVDKVTKL